MTKHFHTELARLERDILLLGGMVEDAVARALAAWRDGDAAAASRVIEGDHEVDEHELRIEEECLKLLALYAPTARDLRFVIGILKITNDLERVGDLAKNLAERVGAKPEDARPVEEMGAQVLSMLRSSLDAFVAQDEGRAREVLAMDDAVDARLRAVFERQVARIREDGARAPEGLRLLSCAKYLERIADHATNVAEDVVYMVSGAVVRHRL